jgi:hypothetical protein
MPLDNPRSGFGNASEFQSSALPYITSSTAPAAGSPVLFRFPKVTRFICVSNAGNTTLSFGFTQRGVTTSSNKFVLSGSQSITLELRVRDLWLQGEGGTPAYTLCAGLTNISRDQMPVLTGTLSNGDSGWDGVG